MWVDPATGELQPKLHIYYRLAEPTRNAAEHAKLKRANRIVAALTGSDPTAISLVHPLRLPGSIHRKGEPKHCRIVELNPPTSSTSTMRSSAWNRRRPSRSSMLPRWTPTGSGSRSTSTALGLVRATTIPTHATLTSRLWQTASRTMTNLGRNTAPSGWGSMRRRTARRRGSMLMTDGHESRQSTTAAPLPTGSTSGGARPTVREPAHWSSAQPCRPELSAAELGSGPRA